MIRQLPGKKPKIHPSTYIDPAAQVIGDVEIGADSSVWPMAVLRGDVHWIRVGKRSNVQDGTMCHVTTGTHPLILGDDVTIGHGAVLHGCTIGNRVLVGMGAIVLDGAVLEDDCMIGAGALVPEGKRIPSGHLALGVPARVVRPLRPDEIQHLKDSALHYVDIWKSMYREVERDAEGT